MQNFGESSLFVRDIALEAKGADGAAAAAGSTCRHRVHVDEDALSATHALENK
jgi:hypothetical protein